MQYIEISILLYVPWGIVALLPLNAGVVHFVANGKKNIA